PGHGAVVDVDRASAAVEALLRVDRESRLTGRTHVACDGAPRSAGNDEGAWGKALRDRHQAAIGEKERAVAGEHVETFAGGDHLVHAGVERDARRRTDEQLT